MTIPGISIPGAAWLAKALHPSDIVADAAGIPTQEGAPCCPLNYTATYIVEAPADVDTIVETWNYTGVHAMHPCCFGKCVKWGYNGVTFVSDTQAFLNQQLGAASGTEDAMMVDMLFAWSQLASQYRPTHMGVTYTLTAPAVTNQGTCAAAQMTLPHATLTNMYYPAVAEERVGPRCTSVTSCPSKASVVPKSTPSDCRPLAITRSRAQETLDRSKRLDASPAIYAVAVPVEVCPDLGFDISNNPRSSIYKLSSIQGMPGAYVGHAKDGCYLPIKLDQEAMRFKSVMERITPASLDDGNFTSVEPYKDLSLFVDGQTHPYLPDGLCYDTDSWGTPVMPASSYNMGVVHFEGISGSATLTVTIRVGFEAIVPPNSLLVPNITKPVVYDPIALQAYWRISRELLAAYPASYNFLGTLWDVIRQIGAAILPDLMPKITSKVLSWFKTESPQSQIAPQRLPAKLLQQTQLKPPPAVVPGQPRRRLAIVRKQR